MLALARPNERRDEVAAKFPTAALATLTFDDAAWVGLRPGGAELVGFVRPRDVKR